MPKSITWMKENEQPKIYTESELQEAIKQEKEECALVCLDVATMFTENTDNHTVALSCANAIRNKEALEETDA